MKLAILHKFKERKKNKIYYIILSTITFFVSFCENNLYKFYDRSNVFLNNQQKSFKGEYFKL